MRCGLMKNTRRSNIYVFRNIFTRSQNYFFDAPTSSNAMQANEKTCRPQTATYNIATENTQSRHAAFIPNLSLASKFKRQRGFEMLAPSEGSKFWKCTILVTCQSTSTFASRKSCKIDQIHRAVDTKCWSRGRLGFEFLDFALAEHRTETETQYIINKTYDFL